MGSDIRHDFYWEFEVPIFRNRIVLKQLALGIGIPFTVIFMLVVIISKGQIFNIYALYTLLLVAAAFFLTYLLVMIVYKGKYSMGFQINDKGITNFTLKKTAKKNNVINRLTIFMGIVSRSPSAIGAGMLANARQNVLVKWKSIRKIKFLDKQKVIMINGGFGDNIALFCNNDNYDHIEKLICEKQVKFGYIIKRN
ncbi:MAG: hypothetical protein JXQ23_08175 [Clostridia bacterium]|nr:hypothetical protein [Clostridia bacterium]